MRFVTNFVKPTQEFLNEFKILVNNYVWNGSVKIKRLTAIADYDEGGLRLPDIDAILESQKIMWVKRYICNKAHPWTIFFKRQLEKIGDNRFIFHQNFDQRAIKNANVDEQYKDIFLAWVRYTTKPIDKLNVLDQHIFL